MTTPRILVDKETGEEFEVCGGFMDPDGILDVIRPIPKPEKSLEEEVRTALNNEGRVLHPGEREICRALDRRFKELKK